MKIKELYNKIPAASRDILKYIDSYIINLVWSSAQDSGITEAQRTAISNNIWASVLSRDVSITILNLCELYNIDFNNITDDQIKAIYSAIFMTYQNKWIKMWENIYMQEYNPVWNVDGEESTVRTYEYGKTSTDTKDFSIEYARDSSDTTTVTDSITDTDIYGFNDSSPVGAAKNTNNGESEVVHSGTDTDTHTGTDTVAETGCDTERITHTRQGNIGVTKSTELLMSEITLREVFNYFDIVSKDIIQSLTMGIY